MNPEVIAVPAIDTWPLVVSLAQTPALLALVKTLHLLGAALLVGPVVAFDMRVLGWNGSVVVSALGRHLLPLAVASLVLLLPTGVALFAVEATRLLGESAFMLKMGLILAGGVIAVLFHSGPYRQVADWDIGPAPTEAKLCAVASVAGWIGVLFCAALIGRT